MHSLCLPRFNKINKYLHAKLMLKYNFKHCHKARNKNVEFWSGGLLRLFLSKYFKLHFLFRAQCLGGIWSGFCYN